MEQFASFATSRTIEAILAGNWESLSVEAITMLFDGHGGRRPGAGRKAQFGNRQKPFTIVLSKEHYDYLISYPEGATACVRALVDEFSKETFDPQRMRGTHGITTYRTSITLPPSMRAWLEGIGGGNAVSGIRRLIEIKLAQGK